jgi:hypothetical protein
VHLFTIAVDSTDWAVVLGLPALGLLPNPTPTPARWLSSGLGDEARR